MKKGTFYWDRRPGKFVEKDTGEESKYQPGYLKNVQEWYMSLHDTIIDADIALLDHQGIAIVCGLDVGTIFECLVAWRPHLASAPRPGQHTVYSGTLGRYCVFFSNKVPGHIAKLITVSDEDYVEIVVKGLHFLDGIE